METGQTTRQQHPYQTSQATHGMKACISICHTAEGILAKNAPKKNQIIMNKPSHRKAARQPKIEETMLSCQHSRSNN